MAWRNLWRNRRRTLLTLVSIAFGTLLAVLFTAMQDRNFADTIDLAARLSGGHVALQHPDYLEAPSIARSIRATPELLARAAAAPGVEQVVVRVTGEAMLSTASDSFSAGYIGYDPAAESPETLSFLEGVASGRMLADGDEDGTVLGATLARNLGLKLGQKVVATMADREGRFAANLARLRGTIGTGAPSLDSSLALLPIERVRQAVGYAPDEATRVALFLADSRRSAAVAGELRNALGPEVAVLTWDEQQPQLASFIRLKVGGARVMEIIIALLVAAGIFNTLFVSVMERLREFGILMAIGFSPGQLFRLVLWESLWLALAGLALGALATAGPYAYLATHGIDFTGFAGEQGAEVAGIGMSLVLKVGIYPEHALQIALAVVLAVLAAGLYPAWRAGRVVPVETVRLV